MKARKEEAEGSRIRRTGSTEDEEPRLTRSGYETSRMEGDVEYSNDPKSGIGTK